LLYRQTQSAARAAGLLRSVEASHRAGVDRLDQEALNKLMVIFTIASICSLAPKDAECLSIYPPIPVEYLRLTARPMRIFDLLDWRVRIYRGIC
jgi:hypothetical protein